MRVENAVTFEKRLSCQLALQESYVGFKNRSTISSLYWQFKTAEPESTSLQYFHQSDAVESELKVIRRNTKNSQNSLALTSKAKIILKYLQIQPYSSSILSIDLLKGKQAWKGKEILSYACLIVILKRVIARRERSQGRATKVPRSKTVDWADTYSEKGVQNSKSGRRWYKFVEL